MSTNVVRLSKWMSLVLRHEPEKFGLQLDAHGWVQIDDLLAAAQRAGVPLTRASVEQVVADNDKQRFALNAEGTAIRARQGHSVTVDLELVPLEPPELLYHGTATRFVEAIRREGLVHGSRQHVHLSADAATATKIGQRHGAPAVLAVQSGAMHRDGLMFYRSENGVWLADAVPPQYLVFP